MKENKRFIGWRLQNLVRSPGWLKLALALLFGMMAGFAGAQPANDDFTNAIAITGLSGTIGGTNNGATLELPCEPTNIFFDDFTNVDNSVWYEWTAPAYGTLTVNTIGSGFDTVLAVYTTANGLCDPSLTQIAADDNYTNAMGVLQTNSLMSFPVKVGTTYYISVNGNAGAAPFDEGNFLLNWNFSTTATLSPGAFRFTSSSYIVSESDSTAPNGAADGDTVSPSVIGTRVTVTRPGPAYGRVLVDYQVSGSTYVNLLQTNFYGSNVFVTVIDTNENITQVDTYSTNVWYTNQVHSYDANNNGDQFFPVVGGYTNYLFTSNFVNTSLSTTNSFSSGLIGGLITTFQTNFLFNFTNNLPTNYLVYSNIVVILGVTNVVYVTNITYTNIVYFSYQVFTNQMVPSASGISAVSGTLVFDDFQMSADILVPVSVAQFPLDVPYGVPYPPSLASITLSNPRLDPSESPNLEPPTLSAVNSTAAINALSPRYFTGVEGTPPNNLTAAVGFERSTFRVDKDEGTATVSVYCYGNPADTVTVSYRIDYGPGANEYHGFQLQAGSDYATPFSDYTPVNNTLTFAAGANNRGTANPQTITVPILNNGLIEFNEDMQLELYNATPAAPAAVPGAPYPILFNGAPLPGDQGAMVGEVGTSTLTILFDDRICGQQPAGAVDRCWNPNGVSSSSPPFLNYPGTQGSSGGSVDGNGGNVYAVAEQPDGSLIIAGSFISFDSNPYNRIARLLNDGYQDTSFLVAPNSGANDFIAALALQPDGKILIGGNFTAFNGVNRYHIARLNSDGSLDATFNPGVGANGIVWSIAVQTNGQVVIGGSFSSVNGTNMNAVARLNADGSLDSSFNPGAGPNGTVNSVVVDSLGRVIIGGAFDTVSGNDFGGVARLSVDGSVDTSFNPGIGTYNAATGFTDPVYALDLQPNGQLLVGGGFSYFDLASYNGLVRLNTDGTVDTSFNPGTGTYNPVTEVADSVKAIIIQPDGTILIGGDFTTFNQTRRVGLTRLYPDGTVDTSFMDTAYNQFAGPVNYYENPDAVNNNLYPAGNTRNFVDALAIEEFTNVVATTNILNVVTNNSVVTTNFVTITNVTGGNVIMGGSFLVVGGGSTRDDTRPRSNVARLIGNSTPGPGNIEFASNGAYSVDKNAGTLFVSLVRSSINSVEPAVTNNLGAIAATFSTNMPSPGPGIASVTNFSLPANYTEPTWPTIYSLNENDSWTVYPGVYGPNQQTIPTDLADAQPYVSLTINNNTIITGNVNANLALSAPASPGFNLGGEYIPLGAALGALTTTNMTIIDDNVKSGTVGFTAAVYTTNQNAGMAIIAVTRVDGTAGAQVSINYATSNGTGVNGVDYNSVSGTLTFNGANDTETFTVPIINGNTAAPDKTVNLTLSGVTGGAAAGLTNAVLTIVNDNYANGHLSFSSATYSTNENDGTALITVNRLGGSTGTLTVNYATSNGSAVSGVNYTATSGVLTWDDGDASPKTFAVPVIHDGVYTTNLTVNLNLTNATVNTFANQTPLSFGGTNAVLTIINVDFPGTLEFSSPVYSVKKYGGFALIPVVRVGGSAGTISVTNYTFDGTASNGVNYTGSTNTLVFTNGQVSQYFNVPIINNTNATGPLYLNLALSGTNYVGSPSNAVLNIIDTTTVNETPGTADPTYSSFAGFNGNVFAFAQYADNNQLLVGGDFTQADGVPRQRIARLNADGSLDATFSLPSSTWGANGTVRALAIQSDGRIIVGGFFTNFNGVAMNRIARLNQDGSLDSTFSPGSGADNPVYAVAETFAGGEGKVLLGGGFATVNGMTFNGIAQLNDDGTPDTTFNSGGLGANATVYALAVQTDGKILIGGDFTSVNGNTNLNHIARLNPDGSVDAAFNAGTGANASVQAITLQLDGRILIGGQFTNVNGVALNSIARLNADGSVDDSFTPGVGANDTVSGIALQSDNRIVLGGQFTRCSGVTRNRITRLNPDGTVDPTINFGSGADNFVAAVVVQEGTIAGYPTNIPDEKIIIGGGFTHYDGAEHDYIARIFGGSISGVGQFQFSSADYQADEDGSNAVITVIRTGGTSGTNADGSGDVLVPFATSDGSAHAGVNYLSVMTNLDFPPGEVQQTVAIPLINDGLVTSNLTVNLAISPVTNTEYGNQPTAVLTIINDDTAVAFASPAYQVPKNVVNGVATINIQRLGGTNSACTVVFNTTTNGTAVIGTDYTPVTNALVTFNPGVTNVVVTIGINNNGIPEGNRTVTMQLSNAVNTLLYSPSNAVLTIIDTVFASGQLDFSATNYTYRATDTNAYLTVLRTNGSSGIVSVSYMTAALTAVPGVDFAPTNGILTFGDGITSQTIAVPLLLNNLVQGPVTLSVILTNATGGATLVYPTNATVTILNTNTAFAFALATNTVAENDGFVALNVLRLNNTNGTVSVNYSTADGTALAAVNYTPVSGTLTFTNGVVSQTIIVPLIDDPHVTGDLQFQVGLSGPVGGQLIAPSVTTVIEQDANAGLSFTSAGTSVLKSATNAVISVVISNPRVEPVTVNYMTVDGTAINGVDYVGPTPSFIFTNGTIVPVPGYGTLVFAGGITTNTFTIPILTNNLPGNRTFSVELFGPTGAGQLVPPSVETVTIIDSNPRVSFSSPAYAVSKTGVQATINVYRTGYTDSVMSVDYQTANGTAVAGSDYVAANGTLVFTNGVTNETFAVTVVNLAGTQPQKTVLLSLLNETNALPLAPTNAVLTILDNNNPGISFAATATALSGNAPSVALTVLRLNNTNGPVTVEFATEDETAVAGTNYVGTNGTLTFPAGVSSQTIVVPLIANTNLTGSLQFAVNLSSPGGGAQLVAPATETVTLQYAAPVNTQPTTANPVLIGGDWGSDSYDNTAVLTNFGTPLVWFAWTATNSGEVEFDTIGSVDDVLGVTNLATYMGVFGGTNFDQVALNTGFYQNPQYNYSGQNIFSLPSLVNSPANLNGAPVNLSISGEIYQPFAGPSPAGPSHVRFNAVAGQTYYVVVETYQGLLSEAESESANSLLPVLSFNTVYSPPAGLIKLNWAFHPSGVFRFAAEDYDETGMAYSNGIPMQLYRVSETEESRRTTGTVIADQYDSTIDGTIAPNGNWAYTFDIPGLLVTVTRAAGSSGRVQVNYTTEDIATNSSLMGTNGFLLNGDMPASSAGQLIESGTNITVQQEDYTPVSGTLTFDDSEVSKTIFIPILDDGGLPRLNRDFLIVLTNAALDASESTDVQPPRLDPTFSQTLVRILDADISPQGPSQTRMLVTNIDVVNMVTNVSTNLVYNLQPTNGVFNFMKAHYRVTRDITNYWGATPITVYVTRMGTNTSGATVFWRVNSQYLDNSDDADLLNGEFPLQPGSDYATPDPVDSTGILGLVHDFQVNGGAYHGSVTFPSGNTAFDPQPIHFTIYNNGLQQFNEDFTISLYQQDSHNNALPAGMIDQTTVTILFDDNHPPAGSVDEFYNADFSLSMTGPFLTVPQQMTQPGADGEVYGVAVQPDNKTVLVGDFFSYDQSAANCIARANLNGSFDTTFNPGSGANDYISCVVLTTNSEVLIGGNFSSYNGSLRNGIALVNTNGSLDNGFNPGAGFNGTVNALALQPDGRILAGGNFTSYNGTPCLYVARLNPDGSLDATFNPAGSLNAAVNAIAVESGGQVVVGGNFTSAGGVPGQDYIARLNADGTFDPGFDPGSGANAAVFALGIQPDGNIVVGGNFSQINGQSLNNIARLNANGFSDPNFFCGVGSDGPVYDITIQTNAIFSTTNSGATTNPIVAVQTNFTIYVGGAFTAFNGTHRLGFTRLNSDGTVDTTFLDTAYNEFAGLPRERYGDPVGTVLASGIQSDGKVMIGGSFERVGGGQSDDEDVRPESVDTNDFLIAESYISQAQKTRSGIRNRSNFARLIGGATPGPGNIGLLPDSSAGYSVPKSTATKNVSLVRTNGTLGPASVNFAVLPGLAQNGEDYSYSGLAPLYWISWERNNPMGRMHSDGLFGNNGFSQDVYGRIDGNDEADVAVSIIDSTNSLSNLSAQFKLTDPANADQFYLGGQDIPLGVALGESVAPLTLIDDHLQAGTFGFVSSNYTGVFPSASIGVTRSGVNNSGLVSLNYATTTNGSTAILGSDYNAASGTLTFQPAVTNLSFNVQILNSNYSSSVEKYVNLQLSGLNSPAIDLASWGLTNAVLRIINPNFQGYLNLSASAYAVNLSAGSVPVTVTRTVGSLGTLRVQFATASGTAVSGTDFVGINTNLLWNSGDVSPRTIIVPLINNGALGLNKQFDVSLSGPTLNNVLTPSLFAATGITNAVVTINNDNTYGAFEFSAPDYVVNEDGGNALVTVIRTGSTNGTATVQFGTADATAFAATNYVATNGTLTFVPGQLAASFAVQILNDGKTNPPPGSFLFVINLSSPGIGASLGTPSTTSVHIVDAQSFNRPPGNADTTFNTGSGMNADVFALALQSNGQILAGGNFTTVNGVPENYIARLNTDGSLDRSGFLYGLSGASGAVYALADQTDGQILIGGAFTSLNGTILNRVARLNTDGSQDTSFNPGAGADNTVYALAETFIGGSREIYAGGSFSTMNGISSPDIVRLYENGTVDTGFKTGAGPNGAVYAVAAYPTNSPFAGKMLIGGAFTSINNFAVGGIARLNVDGSIDTNFDLNLNASSTVRAIAIQDDGSVLIGGDFTNVDGVALNYIARLNSDGSLDAGFTAGVGVGANGTVNGIAVQADNRIVVVGQFTQASGVTRNRITRLMPDGTVDPTINFGDGANGAVNAVVIQPADQMLVIGGSFTQYNDQFAGHIARVYGGSITGSGAFEFTSAGYQVDENGVQALIGILRVGGTSGTNADGSGDVFVNFYTTNGTAVAGVNYSNVNVNVDFPVGEVLKIIPVPVMNDSNISPNLTVNLVLTNATPPAGLGNQASAVLTIINDNGAVSFGSGNYSVAKNILTGYGLVDVVRLGTTNGTCSVDYLTTTNGSAVIGTDYYPTNGTITFNPGVTDVQIQVPVINNDLPEGNQTVDLVLTNAVDTMLYSPSNAVLTIIDTVQAPGELSFSATNYVANSSDGNAYLTVVRTNGTSGSVSVTYSTVPGTAVPQINYQTTTGTLTFNDGDTNKSFAVPLIYNSAAQPAVNLSVVLSAPTGGATLVAPTNTTVTILNTNTVFYFAAATNAAPENSGYVVLTVLRNNTNGTASVSYATADGTAIAGVNYMAQNGTLTFATGVISQTITNTLYYDTQVTGDLQYTVSLSNPSSGTYLTTPSTNTVIVQDADAGLSFTNATMSVLKNGTNAVITVVCGNPRVEPLTVGFFTADGTATNGIDYVGTNGTLVFANGVATNTFLVPIINNSIQESNLTFSVMLTNATGTGQLESPSNQVVTIIDSNPYISFSSPTYSVINTSLVATITVYRTGYTDSVMSVDYATADGTATSGANYVGTGGTLVLTNGVTNATFSVILIHQPGVQPTRTVLLNLSNPTNCVLTPPTNAVLTIYSSAPGISFTATSFTNIETGGSVAVGVQRIGDTSGSVTVNYATTNGTAIANVNYTGVTNTFTFAPGETLGAIIIPLLYDNQVTGNLTFGVNLSNPGNGAQLVSPTSATVVVLDADAGLSFTSANFSVLKNAGIAIITVVCSNPNVEPVSVNYATADGTATNGIDYLAASGTLTFTNGIATNTFAVSILNNGLVTGNRTFTVSLSNPTAPGQLISPSVQTVTIIDSNSGLSYSSPTYTVDKNGIAATINVIRTGFTNSVVSVNFLATNGTAVAGINFVSTNGTLLFSNGVTSQSFSVPIINTTVVQPDETVLLSLASPVGALIVPPAAAVLTIHDTSGSFVIPAGSALVSETGAGAPNGIIDSNETVIVLFAFRDAGGTNVSDLVATLSATNGVTSVSPPSESYGPLIYGGHSVSRPFQFTAEGTNGQQIVATFQLQDGAKPIGSAAFGYTLGSWTTTFSNSAPIYIPAIGSPGGLGAASPYPSIINVSGVGGSLVKATLTVTNLSHQSPSDICGLLVSPSQQTTLFMANDGGGNSITKVTLKFDDAATNYLPPTEFPQITITNGTYIPSGYSPVPNFP